VGRANGITPEQVTNLHDYPTSPHFSPLEKLVLQYADCMTWTPAEIPQEIFDQLRENFSDPQLVELTASIAWENYRARFDHAFGIEAENFSEGTFCAIPVREEKSA
jgi:alkylhydroperoxidase family enzyme